MLTIVENVRTDMVGIRLLECSKLYYILRHHLHCRSMFKITPIANDFITQRHYNDLASTEGKIFVNSQLTRHDVIYILFFTSEWFMFSMIFHVSLTGCRDIHNCLCSGSQKSERNRKSKQLLERSLFSRATVHSHG